MFINTATQVRRPITPQMTQASVNQGLASADRQNNIYSLFKQQGAGGNGFSIGPSDYQRAGSAMAMAGASRSPMEAQKRLADAATNAQSQLRGEVNRENESFGLAGLMSQADQANRGFGFQQQGMLMNILQSLLGGV